MSTGLSTLETPAPRATLMARLGDYVELAKPRIVLLELVAVLVTLHVATGYAAAGSAWSAALMLAVTLGTTLVAASANTLNQWLEWELDARMPRTAGRPIPAGTVTPAEALLLGVIELAMGVSLLAMHAGLIPAVVALATWAIYVACYTPLKPRSWTNTAVGAVSGATPLWIGWTAGGRGLDEPLAWVLVAVMYAWQFPHFMAIAWLSREGYRAAGHQMSTVLDPTGWWAGVQAVGWAIALVPISLAPLVFDTPERPLIYAAAALLGGVMLWRASQRFARTRTDATAKSLLRVSLVYVPLWLLALWTSGV